MQNTPPFDFAPSQRLLATVEQLEGFSAVREWDTEAQHAADACRAYIVVLQDTRASCETQLQESRVAHAKKGFFSRMLSSDSASQTAMQAITGIDGLIATLEDTVEELNKWITLTPDDVNEAKQMVKELKLAKKQLAAEKKELRLQVREVNIRTRIASAHISNQVIFTNSKLKNIQRASVRMNKERSLAPFEQQIRDLEQQQLEIERSIHWIEAFVC